MNERTIRVLGEIDKLKEELIELTIKITEIPSPPFGEEKRGEYIHEKFEQLGYRTRFDGLGNVIAYADLEGKDHFVVLSAHLDTVFPEDTDVTVRREGDTLYAPGVCDDSRGLAVLLKIAELCNLGLNTEEEVGIVFVATLGEEGLGDLRGVKYLFNNEEHYEMRERLRAFITLDGIGINTVVNSGLGSRRYKIKFLGPGGHSFGAFGMVNPIHSLGKVAVAISEWKVPSTPKSTFAISGVSGGRSINAIPDSCHMLLDTRSEDVAQLDMMMDDLEFLCKKFTRMESKSGYGNLEYSIEVIGDRPPGKTSHESALVKAVVRANESLKYPVKFSVSSTDANIPMSIGIPAVCVASVHKAGRAHSLEEFVNADDESLDVVKRNYLLLEYLFENLKSEIS